MNTPKEVLLQFIADENAALTRGEQGSFWPDNHHRITPLIKRAHGMLDEDALLEAFFHLLRLNSPPSLNGEQAFPVLRAAYQRVVPLFAERYPRMHLQRLRGLLLFGFDDLGELADEPPLTWGRYQEYLALWRYLNSFTHVSGILRKRSKFVELGKQEDLVHRVRKAMVQSPLAACLPFPPGLPWIWAMVFMTLHDAESGRAVARKLVREKLDPGDRSTTLEILERCLLAADRGDLLELLQG